MDIEICNESVLVDGLESIRFKRLLNQGKFGKVYLAVDDVSQKMLAVKVVPCHTPYAESSMEREASIALLAKHPAIINTYKEARDEDGTFYLVQELATGGDLYHFLMNYGPCGAKHEILLKVILVQLASALTYLHNDLNVVYRDIKLENICIMQPSESYADWSIRLVDFGLASFMDKKKRANFSSWLRGYADVHCTRGDGASKHRRTSIASYKIGQLWCRCFNLCTRYWQLSLG